MTSVYRLPIKKIRAVGMIDTKTRKYIASIETGDKSEEVPTLKTTNWSMLLTGLMILLA